MTDFYDVDFRVSTMSRDKLNKIALSGGRVGGIGYGYGLRGSLPKERHGYGFKWINKKGMGNHGSLILTARSDEAAEYLRQGKIGCLMDIHGLEYSDADSLYSASYGVRWGIEPGTLAYAIQTRDCRAAWNHFPADCRGVHRWLKEWKMPDTELSAPRLSAVAEILEKWS